MSKPIISCRNLRKSYYQGELEVPVLMGIDLEVSMPISTGTSSSP